MDGTSPHLPDFITYLDRKNPFLTMSGRTVFINLFAQESSYALPLQAKDPGQLRDGSLRGSIDIGKET